MLIKYHQIPKLAKYIQTYQSQQYQQLQEDCQRLIQHEFLFHDNWDMEPCHHVYKLMPLRWDIKRHSDLEWTYMLNRQEYLWKLAMAHAVEQEEVYLDKLKYFICDWIKQVECFSPLQSTTRTLDTGIRCLSWIKSLLYLQEVGSLGEHERSVILISLKRQLEFLKQHYRPKDTLSNWGVFQTVPMLVAHAYFGKELNSEQLHEFAYQELCEQVRLQILEDGTQFEQSILYHVEVYKVLLELVILIPHFKQLLYPVLQKMAYYIQMMTTSDGHTFAFGDSDAHNMQDILNLSALVLKDNTYLEHSDGYLDLYSLFLTGSEGLAIFQGLKKEESLIQRACFSNSGQTCLKMESSHVFFKCGPMGSAHTHSDNGSLCLYHQGKPIFIDSGRYTYRECAERYYLKSVFAHNTCILDNQAPEKITGSWEYEAYPQFLYHHLVTKEDCSLIEGAYQAHLINGMFYCHKRQILTIGKDVFIVADALNSPGSHTVTTQFILHEQVNVSKNQLNDLRWYSKHSFQLVPTYYSPRYNQCLQTNKLVKQYNFMNVGVDYTVFAHKSIQIVEHPIYQTDNTQLINGLAVELVSATERRLVVMINDEIFKGEKLICVDGIKIRGKCVIINRHNQNFIRLKA